MTAPAGRPCDPWAATFPCSGLPDGNPSLLTDNLNFATWLVWALSGRQYGLCTETVQPCAKPETCWGWVPWAWTGPWGVEGLPIGWDYLCRCGCSDGGCGHDELTTIKLGRRPINSVTAVTIDGETLPTDAYRVDDWQYLRRIDGEGGWPTTQDFSVANGQPGTWSVTYQWGVAPPTGGVIAVQRLACELTRSDLGMECALPARVTSVTRSGISYTVQDPAEMIDGGRTGIYVVDSFIRAANPGKQRRPPAILRADQHVRGSRRTGT